MDVDGSDWPDQKAPWERTTTAKWRNPVEAAPWKSRPRGGWFKVLPCPRCGHQITSYKGSGAVAAAREKEPHQTAVECNCEHEHKGRPEASPGGCGQQAWVTAPRNP